MGGSLSQEDHGHSHSWSSKHAVAHAYGAHALLGARVAGDNAVQLEILFDSADLSAVDTFEAYISGPGADGPVTVVFNKDKAHNSNMIRFASAPSSDFALDGALQVKATPVVSGEQANVSWIAFVPSEHLV